MSDTDVVECEVTKPVVTDAELIPGVSDCFPVVEISVALVSVVCVDAVSDNVVSVLVSVCVVKAVPVTESVEGDGVAVATVVVDSAACVDVRSVDG